MFADIQHGHDEKKLRFTQKQLTMNNRRTTRRRRAVTITNLKEGRIMMPMNTQEQTDLERRYLTIKKMRNSSA